MTSNAGILNVHGASQCRLVWARPPQHAGYLPLSQLGSKPSGHNHWPAVSWCCACAKERRAGAAALLFVVGLLLVVSSLTLITPDVWIEYNGRSNAVSDRMEDSASDDNRIFSADVSENEETMYEVQPGRNQQVRWRFASDATQAKFAPKDGQTNID